MKIDQQVKVIKAGHTYTTYNAMSRYMKLTKWDRRNLPDYDRTYKIIAMAVRGEEEGEYYHHREYKPPMICGIQDIGNGKQYMIGDEGLMDSPIVEFTMEDFEL